MFSAFREALGDYSWPDPVMTYFLTSGRLAVLAKTSLMYYTELLTSLIRFSTTSDHDFGPVHASITFYSAQFYLNRMVSSSRFHLVLQNYVTLREAHRFDYRPVELTNILLRQLLTRKRLPVGGNTQPCAYCHSCLHLGGKAVCPVKTPGVTGGAARTIAAAAGLEAGDSRRVWSATLTKLIALHRAGVEDGSIDPNTGLEK
jgi:hypothetical protein